MPKYVNKVKKRDTVNRLDCDSSSDDSVYTVEHTVGSVKTPGKKWFAALDLSTSGGTPFTVLCQMDCGSTCNLLSYADYCRITEDGNPKLRKSNARLQLYDDTVMLPLGTCKLQCHWQGRDYVLDFQVVNVNQKPLLSATTCEQLGLLTVNLKERVHAVKEAESQEGTVKAQVPQTPLTPDHIAENYTDVFSGLGCLPGEYRVEVDKNVKPVQHQPRRVPVALKSELKKKIEQLEQKQVLAKVTTHTDWISSMVAVRKPSGKMRICIDPKDLNQALKRPHYPMPTIDEVLPRLANAKVFSVLDAKDGFWQVKLEERKQLPNHVLDTLRSIPLATNALWPIYST